MKIRAALALVSAIAASGCGGTRLYQPSGSFGLALPDFNGDESWELPIPARIVIDPEGIVRSVDADPDYTRRPEPESTLETLRGLA